jgi:hypothetical protein
MRWAAPALLASLVHPLPAASQLDPPVTLIEVGVTATFRESDAQTPLVKGGNNESTWFTFSDAPETGKLLDFSAATLAIDTFPKDLDAAVAGTLYQIETSTDLGVGDPWTAVVPDIDNLDHIQFTLPTGESRRFARLAVTLPTP